MEAKILTTEKTAELLLSFFTKPHGMDIDPLLVKTGGNMTWLRLKNWFLDYKIVAFMIFVFFGWIVIWLGWMLFIVITNPN